MAGVDERAVVRCGCQAGVHRAGWAELGASAKVSRWGAGTGLAAIAQIA